MQYSLRSVREDEAVYMYWKSRELNMIGCGFM